MGEESFMKKVKIVLFSIMGVLGTLLLAFLGMQASKKKPVIHDTDVAITDAVVDNLNKKIEEVNSMTKEELVEAAPEIKPEVTDALVDSAMVKADKYKKKKN